MIHFDLEDQEYIELHQLLKTVGMSASGGMAKLMIADGLVRVDGTVETRKRRKVRSGQQVECAGQTIMIS